MQGLVLIFPHSKKGTILWRGEKGRQEGGFILSSVFSGQLLDWEKLKGLYQTVCHIWLEQKAPNWKSMNDLSLLVLSDVKSIKDEDGEEYESGMGGNCISVLLTLL